MAIPAFRTMYAAVRRSTGVTGGEWIDGESLASWENDSRERCAERDARLPKWAALHPVLRVVPVRVEEVV